MTLHNSDTGAGSTNYEMGDTGESVRQLNSLLRGEISAAETYRMAIDKVADSNAPNAGLLREMLVQQLPGLRAVAVRARDARDHAADPCISVCSLIASATKVRMPSDSLVVAITSSLSAKRKCGSS